MMPPLSRGNPVPGAPDGAMDLTYTPEQEEFRKEARAWLEAHVPDATLPSFDTKEIAIGGWRRKIR